jgi:hypothetical protein
VDSSDEEDQPASNMEIDDIVDIESGIIKWQIVPSFNLMLMVDQEDDINDDLEFLDKSGYYHALKYKLNIRKF